MTKGYIYEVMRNIFILFFWGTWIGVFLSYTTSWAQERLSVEEVISITIANNPSIKANQRQIQIVESGIQAARSPFNMMYDFSISKTQIVQPNDLDSRENGNLASKRLPLSYSFSASKRMPAGTELGISANFSNAGKNYIYQDYGLYANRASVFLQATQPLLLGRGRFYNTAPIKASELATEGAKYEYVYQTSSALLNSLTAYIDFISNSNALSIQQENDSLYSKFVADIEKLVELDALPGADTLYIKAQAASQKSNLVYTKNNLAYSKNNLVTSLGYSVEKNNFFLKDPPSQFPITDLIMVYSDSAVKKWVADALVKRADYLALLKDKEANETILKRFKQAKKPSLNLDVSVGYHGIYEGKDAAMVWSPYTSNIQGMSYTAGLRFNIAPAFDAVNADIIRTESLVERNQHNLTALENDIALNVQRYYDQIRYFSETVSLYEKAVSHYQTALANENTKLRMGVSTIINLVQIQTNYIASKMALNYAIQNLNNAILLLRFYTGTLITTDDLGNLQVLPETLFKLPD